MKKINIFLSAVIAVISLAGCQTEPIQNENQTSGITHTVKFISDQLQTKTEMMIDDGISYFFWDDGDEDSFTVFENGVAAVESIGVEANDVMTIASTFNNPTEAPDLYRYDAYLNYGVPARQTCDDVTYDRSADVLVAKPLIVENTDVETKADDANTNEKELLLQFKRVVAISQMTIKGMAEGEIVESVVLSSDKPITGDFTLDTSNNMAETWSNDGTTLTIIPDELMVDESGEAIVNFISRPVEGAQLTITVTTDENTYSKTFASTITLSSEKVKIFGVTVEEQSTPGPARFEKVTSAPDNGDWSGDYLIVYETESLAFDGSLTTLDATSNTKPVTIEDAIIAATSDMMAIRFTVAKKSESSDKYNLKSASGYYISGTTTSATASNGIKQSTSDSVYEITFGVESNNVVVYSKSSDQNMILRYNDASNQNRFRFYKSGQKAISLYKFYGTIQSIPVESVSLDIEEYELGEGSHVQLTPTVAPAEATNKNVTWSTSDGSVATVENGLVTAVGEGTATIKVTTEDGGFAAECEITVLPKYNITISSEIANGTVSSNVASAIAGTEITLTATPNAAYEFTSWDVKDASDNSITVTDNKFTMPASAVTVNASFSQILLEDMDAIFAKATEVGNKATNVFVKFTNYVVSGAKDKNVYVTDGAKGFIIFESNNGFVANDKLNGTIQCKVQLFNGSAELTGVTASSTGLTVTKGEALVAQTIPTDNLSGINTGVLLTYSAMKYNSTTKKLSDDTNTIEPYTTLYSYTSLTNGQKYDVTGVYLQYNDKQEILPRSAAEITKFVAPSYNITIADNIANGSVSASQSSAQEGVQIILTPIPSEGYCLGAWDVKDSDGIAITVTENKFTMPAKDIIVSATFTQKENHAIRISSSIANGTVTASLSEAYEGQEITLIPNPAAGYKFSEWDVKDANNNTVSVESNKFRMPDTEVIVSATFVSQSVPEPVVMDKTISSYAAGEQYATNEKHDLGDGFVIYTTECHFTSELRIYSSSTHDGYVISDPFSGPITEIRFNAGNNSDTINVYGSNDGETWSLVGSKSVVKTYADYTVSFGTNSYKQFKLDVAGANQVRIKTLGVTYTPTN